MSDDKMPELLPCPFCGSSKQPTVFGLKPDEWWVECSGYEGLCCKLFLSTTKEEAIRKWNTRTVSPDAPLDAECPTCGLEAKIHGHSSLRCMAAPEDSPMKQCAKCGRLFRYPPSDNKESETRCVWCVEPASGHSRPPAASGARTHPHSDACWEARHKECRKADCICDCHKTESRAETIRRHQRSGGGEVTAIMVSRDNDAASGALPEWSTPFPCPVHDRLCKTDNQHYDANGTPAPTLCIDCHHNNLVGQYCAEIVQRGDVQRACGCRCVFGAPEKPVGEAGDRHCFDPFSNDLRTCRYCLRPPSDPAHANVPVTPSPTTDARERAQKILWTFMQTIDGDRDYSCDKCELTTYLCPHLFERLQNLIAAALSSTPTATTSAIEAAKDWQPIETYPKFGRIVLLFAWCDEGRNWKKHTGHYNDIIEAWIWNGEVVKDGDLVPTHWMPLPDPPNNSDV